jgi:putative membrane protein
MQWLVKIAFVVAGNAFALWLANRYIPGFVLSASLLQLIVIALVLSLLNYILKPVLTLVLGPVIVITLGLGIIIVNALIIYLLPVLAQHLDFLAGSITIQTIAALVLTTLIVSAVNFVIHLAV